MKSFQTVSEKENAMQSYVQVISVWFRKKPVNILNN